MNITGSPVGLLFLGFNQDYTRLGVGTHDGFEVWDLEPLQLKFKRGRNLCMI